MFRIKIYNILNVSSPHNHNTLHSGTHGAGHLRRDTAAEMAAAVLLVAWLAAPQSIFLSEWTTASKLVIGVDELRYGTLYWNEMPQPEQVVYTTVGTKLVFNYDTDHDVGLVPSERAWMNCDLGGLEELASTRQGGGATGEPANLFAAVVGAVGEYYFVCGQSGHCLSGQKIKVIVTMGSPPPPHSPPPPQAPPMAPRRIWPSPVLPPPSPPPSSPCKDSPTYEEDGLTCSDWVGKECLDDVQAGIADGSLAATFDLQKLLTSCPDGCLVSSLHLAPPPCRQAC